MHDVMLVEKAPVNAVVSASSPLRRAGIIIPTYNAGRYWNRMRAALEEQGIAKEQVLIVDSSSLDNTQALVRQDGYPLKWITQQSFRHGGTRQMAAKMMPWAEYLVYFTQDAAPCGANSIERLLLAFENPAVGAAYGRQLPRPEADAIERHARLFNYPETSSLRTFASRKQMGIKAAFFSNSFAAYRCSALETVGGFPRDTIVSEDVTVAARLLMSNWKLAYQADATVVHSHHFTVLEEFSRYFDIGVHHSRESWILEAFGKAGNEGRAFVQSEFLYLLKERPSLIPRAIVRTFGKALAYHLGTHERRLPDALKLALSAQPRFWLKNDLDFFATEKQADVRTY
jgi:rhamnosyltransferase